ncbi:MAG: helix-turn-helix domain-containing protein [Myxococcota bacterium]
MGTRDTDRPRLRLVGDEVPAKSSSLNILGQAPPVAERADAARNRARILEAARKLLVRRSIREICMDELAQAAGVGKGTLYRRFVDRASLCHALLDDNERQLQARVLRGFDLPRDTNALTRMDVFLRALFDHVVENASLLAEAHAYERGDADRVEHPVMVWRRRELARLLELLVRENGLPHLDSVTTAHFVIAALEPDLITSLMRQGMTHAALRQAFLSFARRAAGLPSA